MKTRAAIAVGAGKPLEIHEVDLAGPGPSEVGQAGARLQLQKLGVPEKGEKVEFIEGDTPQAQAAALVARLKADKLI